MYKLKSQILLDSISRIVPDEHLWKLTVVAFPILHLQELLDPTQDG